MLTQYVSPDDFDYHILVHSVLVIHVLNHTQIIVYKIANVSITEILLEVMLKIITPNPVKKYLEY